MLQYCAAFKERNLWKHDDIDELRISKMVFSWLYIYEMLSVLCNRPVTEFFDLSWNNWFSCGVFGLLNYAFLNYRFVYVCLHLHCSWLSPLCNT